MNHNDPTSRRYLAQLQATPSLSREEELELARAYREHGDRRAADKLVAANLRHVVALALRYRRLGVPVAELVAQGSLGLFLALERFEPERGLRLATYANHWVRAEMLQLVLKQRSLVSGGRGALASKYVFGLRGKHARLLAKVGDASVAARELAVSYRKTPEQIEDILSRIELRDAAFDAAGEGGRAPADRLFDSPPLGTEDALHRERYREPLALAVAEAKARLNERERYIVEHRLMADDEARCSLGAIGRKLGVSRERARQLEQAVKSKLRARLLPLVEQLDLQPAA